jgi:hypothetical protein
MSEYLAAPAVDFTGPLTDTLRSVLLLTPKLLAFGVILLAGWLVALLVRYAAGRVLERIGFNRAVDRGGVRGALAYSQYDAAGLVAALLSAATVLVTLQAAFGVFGPNPVSDLIRNVVGWLPRAAVAVVIVVVASAIATAVRGVVAAALGRLSYGRTVAALARWFVVGLGVVAGLNQVGVATTVTTPVLVAVLATAGGILVVGVGGGLVVPMQRRWDGWLDRAARDGQVVAERASAYAAGWMDLQRAGTGTAGTAPAPPASGAAFVVPPGGYAMPVSTMAPTSTAPAPGDDTRQYPPRGGG